MTAEPVAEWATCDVDGCTGARLDDRGRCIAHLSELDLDAFRTAASSDAIDARGVVLSADLLKEIQLSGRTLRSAQFDRATFQADVSFSGVVFAGPASFNDATFEGEADFSDVTFERRADFARATFVRDAVFFDASLAEASFHNATFGGEAAFTDASFTGTTGFGNVTFTRLANFARTSFGTSNWFGYCTFKDTVWFNRATFDGQVIFEDTTFEDNAQFHVVSFKGDASFDRVRFEGWAEFLQSTFHVRAGFRSTRFMGTGNFTQATFEASRLIGPLLARTLIVDGAVFQRRVHLLVVAASLCARRAHFPAGVRLRVRWATVRLDDADLATPAILAGFPVPFADLDETEAAGVWERLPPGPRAERWRPRLESLRRADVAGLHLSQVDLRPCRFEGAHNLDRLRFEGAPLFARATGWWRTRRMVLAEEHRWRAERPGRWGKSGWYPRACRLPVTLNAPPLPPVQLAALYRELRKGREDAKDEPGAADFYYGEMEMRRLDPEGSVAERCILWLYWLVSGYALRAWRALATLAVVVLLAAAGFASWGFPDAEPAFRPAGVDGSGALVYQQVPAGPVGAERFPEALRFSARSAISLLRGPDRPLTPVGETLEITLRLLGPVLLGLAVLSVRGRVRR